jgi:BMFP domain-containing protein YqiC
MSLTQNDLNLLRTVIREEFDGCGRMAIREEISNAIDTKINPRLDRLEGKVNAVEDDTKEIYGMITGLQSRTRSLP